MNKLIILLLLLVQSCADSTAAKRVGDIEIVSDKEIDSILIKEAYVTSVSKSKGGKHWEIQVGGVTGSNVIVSMKIKEEIIECGIGKRVIGEKNKVTVADGAAKFNTISVYHW